MARKRELRRINPGEYIATIFWQVGSDIEERTRFAEHAGVKVDAKWVYIYVQDGEEVVKLSRTRNSSAQMYVDMSVRDVMRERVRNWTRNSTSCCYAGERGESFGSPECCVHTPEWFDAQIEKEISELIPDADWPVVLAQRKIDAVLADDRLKQAVAEREWAKAVGFGEWRKASGVGGIAIAGRAPGDTVTVRRRDGVLTTHVLGDRLSDNVFRDGGFVPEPETAKTAA